MDKVLTKITLLKNNLLWFICLLLFAQCVLASDQTYYLYQNRPFQSNYPLSQASNGGWYYKVTHERYCDNYDSHLLGENVTCRDGIINPPTEECAYYSSSGITHWGFELEVCECDFAQLQNMAENTCPVGTYGMVHSNDCVFECVPCDEDISVGYAIKWEQQCGKCDIPNGYKDSSDPESSCTWLKENQYAVEKAECETTHGGTFAFECHHEDQIDPPDPTCQKPVVDEAKCVLPQNSSSNNQSSDSQNPNTDNSQTVEDDGGGDPFKPVYGKDTSSFSGPTTDEFLDTSNTALTVARNSELQRRQDSVYFSQLIYQQQVTNATLDSLGKAQNIFADSMADWTHDIVNAINGIEIPENQSGSTDVSGVESGIAETNVKLDGLQSTLNSIDSILGDGGDSTFMDFDTSFTSSGFDKYDSLGDSSRVASHYANASQQINSKITTKLEETELSEGIKNALQINVSGSCSGMEFTLPAPQGSTPKVFNFCTSTILQVGGKHIISWIGVFIQFASILMFFRIIFRS